MAWTDAEAALITQSDDFGAVELTEQSSKLTEKSGRTIPELKKTVRKLPVWEGKSTRRSWRLKPSKSMAD